MIRPDSSSALLLCLLGMSGLGFNYSRLTGFSCTFSAFCIEANVSCACWVLLLPVQLAACNSLLFTTKVLRKGVAPCSLVSSFPAGDWVYLTAVLLVLSCHLVITKAHWYC